MDFSSANFIPVVCITIRDSKPDQISINEKYFLDRLTIWIDHDGDSYGVVYNQLGNRIGEIMLSHFRCE